MSSIPHPQDDGKTATTESSAAERLADWRGQLDRFSAAFDAEISDILNTLANLTFGEADEPPAAATTSDQTMEFTLPAAPTAPLSAAAPERPQQMPAPEAPAEPNRLAALKAKLAQQMASAGHPQATAGRVAEETCS